MVNLVNEHGKAIPLTNLIFGAPLDKSVIRYKAVLRKVLIWYAKLIPEPTRENVPLHNAHILMDIQDWFLLHEDGGKTALFKALFKIGISVYVDPYYGQRIDRIKEELEKREDWEKLPIGQPAGCWKE